MAYASLIASEAIIKSSMNALMFLENSKSVNLLKLRGSYCDSFEIKNKKYCLWIHVISIHYVLKVQKLTSKLFHIFIFMSLFQCLST